jgi:hypothetical protein
MFLPFCGLIILIVILIIKFMTKSFKEKALKLVRSKEIIYSGATNYIVGLESVGGYLILTDYEKG